MKRSEPRILRRTIWLTIIQAFAPVVCPLIPVHGQDASAVAWWNSTVESRIAEAGANQVELRMALGDVRYEHRRALEFLIEHMPNQDLRSLKSGFLLQNIELAYQAINQVPWGKQIPEEIFFNDILPYANVDETREDWRQEMMERCLPLVAECKTPGEAALKLNRELFPLIKVRYATSRKKANQSPSESIQQSVASCTGLSILLTDACRSVGVPSRLAGIPSWTNKRGNHTWVEVWDNGWHFTGAAEPSDQLNRTWFQHDASLADDSNPMNRIYAVSFAKTGMYFPLVWSPRSRETNAVNVTHRYTASRSETPQNVTRVLVSVFSADGTRQKRDVTVTCLNGDGQVTGTTRDESVDMNDILVLPLTKDRNWRISWEEDGKRVEYERSTGDHEQTLWEFRVSNDR